MPAERIAMRQVRDVLRLKTAGLSGNEIARRVGIAPSTVRLTLKRLADAGLGWRLSAEITDAALETQLFTAGRQEARAPSLCRARLGGASVMSRCSTRSRRQGKFRDCGAHSMGCGGSGKNTGDRAYDGILRHRRRLQTALRTKPKMIRLPETGNGIALRIRPEASGAGSVSVHLPRVDSDHQSAQNWEPMNAQSPTPHPPPRTPPQPPPDPDAPPPMRDPPPPIPIPRPEPPPP
jgi:transposase-like protein